MECRKELEDLILEVYENLQSDGVNILLPDEIARKIHGMVHLHRACSKNGDVADDGSIIECGPGCSHDNNDELSEYGDFPNIAEEEIYRVQRIIEEHMAKIDMEVTPMVEQAIAVATHIQQESMNDESDNEEIPHQMLESIPESPVVPKSPVVLESPIIPWEVKEPNLETASLYSMDDDLKEIAQLNNQFDEMFQFMQKEFPDVTSTARYSPGLDATDVESCDGSILDDPAQDLSPPPSPIVQNQTIELRKKREIKPPSNIVKLPLRKNQSQLSTTRSNSQSQLPRSFSHSQLPTPKSKLQTPLPTPLKNAIAKAPPTKSSRSLMRPPASVPKPSTTPIRTRKFSNASDSSDIVTSVSKQESKQDLAAKRRGEKEKRELLAREEARKLREQRRVLAESKAEADKAARAAKADMVKRRREEREKRVLLMK